MKVFEGRTDRHPIVGSISGRIRGQRNVLCVGPVRLSRQILQSVMALMFVPVMLAQTIPAHAASVVVSPKVTKLAFDTSDSAAAAQREQRGARGDVLRPWARQAVRLIRSQADRLARRSKVRTERPSGPRHQRGTG